MTKRGADTTPSTKTEQPNHRRQKHVQGSEPAKPRGVIMSSGITSSTTPLGRATALVAVTPSITMREVKYSPHLSIGRHDHPWAFMSFVIRGAVTETCEGATERRGAGA